MGEVVGLGSGTKATEAQQLGVAPGWHAGFVLAGSPPGIPSLTHSHGLPLQALVLLQLWANLDVLLVASWQELSQHVCTFTKALAQRPFKCVTSTPDGGCGWEGDRSARRVLHPWPENR